MTHCPGCGLPDSLDPMQHGFGCKRDLRVRAIASKGNQKWIRDFPSMGEAEKFAEAQRADGKEVEFLPAPAEEPRPNHRARIEAEGCKEGETLVHVFEKAGLGIAPFRFIGVDERRGPMVISTEGGVTTSCGAPGQPMGVCDYCGEGIVECCVIQDARGKRFIVGNVCVGRTGDKGLKKQMDPILNKARRDARHASEANGIEWAQGQLQDQALCAQLDREPHPMEHMAKMGHTRLSWACWMMDHAGNSGRMQVVRYLRKVVAK